MDPIYLDRTNLSGKALQLVDSAEGYYKVAVVFPKHTWEHMCEVNSVREGKSIRESAYLQFCRLYDDLIERDELKNHFDLILEV